jgi:hypothetical protein
MPQQHILSYIEMDYLVSIPTNFVSAEKLGWRHPQRIKSSWIVEKSAVAILILPLSGCVGAQCRPSSME